MPCAYKKQIDVFPSSVFLAGIASLLLLLFLFLSLAPFLDDVENEQAMGEIIGRHLLLAALTALHPAALLSIGYPPADFLEAVLRHSSLSRRSSVSWSIGDISPPFYKHFFRSLLNLPPPVR